MKKPADEKAPLHIKRIASVVALLLVAAFAYYVFQSLRSQSLQSTDVCIKYQTITNGGKFTPIGTKECVLSLEKVDTEAAREQGLSGRASMPASRGMLFVFDHIDRACIWMKGMKFPLDIAWLNVRGDVVRLEENVRPETYPNDFCADNTFFVIEVNAGVAKSAGLSVGSHINL
jgi:uncharacterized membrane protein (UPF0127 family)